MSLISLISHLLSAFRISEIHYSVISGYHDKCFEHVHQPINANLLCEHIHQLINANLLCKQDAMIQSFLCQFKQTSHKCQIPDVIIRDYMYVEGIQN